jgi:hypothetical protein
MIEAQVLVLASTLLLLCLVKTSVIRSLASLTSSTNLTARSLNSKWVLLLVLCIPFHQNLAFTRSECKDEIREEGTLLHFKHTFKLRTMKVLIELKS